MTGAPLDRLREALDGIRRDARNGGDRAELARRLEALLREVDAALDGLARLRSEGRALLEALRAGGSAAPGPGPRPRVRQDQLGASTFTEKGWHLISQGDHAGAVEALRRALDLAPGDAQATALLGWAEMLQGRYDDAMVTFAQVLQRDPGNALARVNVGYICLRKRIFGEAIEHLSRVIREDADRKASLYAHYYLGLVYLEREMVEDAVSFLARAVELGPNLIEARYELGRALWLAGRREEARGAWVLGAEARARSPWVARCRDALARTAKGEDPSRASST